MTMPEKELHTAKCPWCDWSKMDRTAHGAACQLVSHTNRQHDLWPPLAQAELYVLGDPSVSFADMRPKHRAAGDERPWREIRGGAAV